jgi:hypothetical protein
MLNRNNAEVQSASNRDKAKQKIVKLLNLTQERGATPAEARLAAERVVDQMLLFDIPLTEIMLPPTVNGKISATDSISVLDLVVRNGGGVTAIRRRRNGTLYFLTNRAFVLPAKTVAELIADGSLEPDGPNVWRTTSASIVGAIVRCIGGPKPKARRRANRGQ